MLLVLASALDNTCLLFICIALYCRIYAAFLFPPKVRNYYSKHTKVRFRILVNTLEGNSHVSRKLHLNIIGPISYGKLLNIIRTKTKLLPCADLYIFSGQTPMSPLSIWHFGRIKLTCVDGRTFGSNTSVPEPATNPVGENTDHLISSTMAAEADDTDTAVDPVRSKRRGINKYSVSALYSNTRGLSSNKVTAIRIEATNDTYILGNEWNKTPSDVSLLAKYFGKYAIIKSCHTFTYGPRGSRIQVKKKKQGFGTGVVAKDSNILNKYTDLSSPEELDFEIVPSIFKLSKNTNVGCICVYRSPSMSLESEIRDFYAQIDRYLAHMKNNHELSGIIYIGDPNTESSPLAEALESQIMQKHLLINRIGDVPTRISGSGSETQPDSCFGWFNCARLSITATVIGKICDKMDHRAIRLKMTLADTLPKKPVLKEVTLKTRRPNITDENIGSKIRELFSPWLFKYNTLLFDASDPRPGHCVI